ncbi:MlaE family ABC transporter permease [Bradyrhizobium sp. SYSU BS000235]|uniref:MlaE family ABC transporter permease n=1 Tax=Bradyrhizobium sp. SYSU BS000235 TaxID=3411332 RepID=UPI003C75370D
MTTHPDLLVKDDPECLTLISSGPWNAQNADVLQDLLQSASARVVDAKAVQFNIADLSELDTIGAWFIERTLRLAAKANRPASLVGVAERYADLIGKMRSVNRDEISGLPKRTTLVSGVEKLGASAANTLKSGSIFLSMLGAIGLAGVAILSRPKSFRFTSLIFHIYRVGWQAIPIIALITFLIGAIIAQQGIFHFRKFGAESYVVDMVGILVLREIGVLIVAIMVAGRSGSAYTAELGSMKMREEIDALVTMGRSPVEVLILPRVVALIISLPILAFLGAMAALYGGGMIAWLYGGMSPAIFIARLHDAISVTHFEVGLIKAPFMALVIGVVACSEGLQVKGSAQSLGQKTTTSVVKSIFLVIVLDGVFAIFFASIGM